MPLQSRLNRQPVSVDDAAKTASETPPAAPAADVGPRRRRLLTTPAPDAEKTPPEDHTDTHAGEEGGEETPAADTPDDSGDGEQQSAPVSAPATAQNQTPAAAVAAKVGRTRKSPVKKAALQLPDDIADIEDEATARAMVKNVESEIKEARAAFDAQVAALRTRFMQANEKLAELLGG